MCEQGTVLNNLTLNATNYVADTDGALIYAIGSDVTVKIILLLIIMLLTDLRMQLQFMLVVQITLN